MDTSLFQLEGKSALVVGGGQGMGEAAAKLLAQVGCGVAVADIKGGSAERVAAEVADMGQPSAAIVGDVLEDDQVPRIVERAEAALGGLDVLVATVGQASFAPLVDMKPEQWDRDQHFNLRYFFLIAREAARSMIARGTPGAMTCVSSVAGLQSAPNHASYGVAKAGLVNLVRSMAVEWAPHHIRVNAIAPGSIATPRIPDTPERREKTRQGLIPTKRLGTVDEVAKAALFLVSDLASYVTGTTLAVGGGWMATSILGVPSVPDGGKLDATAGLT